MPITIFLHAELAGALDQRVEHRHERLAAFEREALLADELGVQELLEEMRAGDLAAAPARARSSVISG